MKKVFSCFLCVVSIFVFFAGADFAHASALDEILAKMTLEEKIGQVIVGAFKGDSMSAELRDSIAGLKFGGLIFFDRAGNVTDTKQVSLLIADAQKLSMSEGVKIPLFVTIDQEGGIVARIRDGVAVWPGNMALGATGDVALAEEQARIMGRELKNLGFNFNFAPVVDVNSNPANPVIGTRSFGSDPVKVAEFAEAMLRGFASAGIVATVKHFPGHGDTSIDSHHGLPIIDKSLAELEKIELLPFRRAIAVGVPAVMTSHIIVPALGAKDVPVTLSKEAISFLRNEMKFDGLVLTDALTGMKAIEEKWGSVEASVMALNAGADILIFGFRAGELDKIYPTQKAAHSRIVAAAKSGELPIKRLDEAVLRILRQKEKMGMFGSVPELVAKKSVTLLRNDKKIIPLGATKKYALVWRSDMASSARLLLSAIPNLYLVELPLVPTAEDIAKMKERLKDADAVVAGTWALERAEAWQRALREIAPEKLVLMAMRTPYDITALPRTGTYIAAFSDMPPTINALAEILTGRIAPAGRLPVEIPGLFPIGSGM